MQLPLQGEVSSWPRVPEMPEAEGWDCSWVYELMSCQCLHLGLPSLDGSSTSMDISPTSLCFLADFYHPADPGPKGRSPSPKPPTAEEEDPEKKCKPKILKDLCGFPMILLWVWGTKDLVMDKQKGICNSIHGNYLVWFWMKTSWDTQVSNDLGFAWGCLEATRRINGRFFWCMYDEQR